MKRIRIKNDINVTLTVTRNGQAESLEGRDIKVSLTSDISGVAAPIVPEIHDNIITFMFYGKDQQTTGSYTFTIVENDGLEDMHTLDKGKALILVDRSWKEGDEPIYNPCLSCVNCDCDDCEFYHEVYECDTEVFTTVTVELDVDLAYPKDGKSAYEIAVEHGFEGTEDEFAEGLIHANEALPAAQTALEQIDKTTFRVYRDGGYNMNNSLWYGWWFGCTSGRPSESESGEQYALEVVNCGESLFTPYDIDLISNYPQLMRNGNDGGWNGTFGYYSVLQQVFVERYYGNYPLRQEEICSIVLTDLAEGTYNVVIRAAASSTAARDTWMELPDTDSNAMYLTANNVQSALAIRSKLRTSVDDLSEVSEVSLTVTVGSDGRLSLKAFADAPRTANWFILQSIHLYLKGEPKTFMVIKQTCHSNLAPEKSFRRIVHTTDRNKFEAPWTYYGAWERLEAPIAYIETLN